MKTFQRIIFAACLACTAISPGCATIGASTGYTEFELQEAANLADDQAEWAAWDKEEADDAVLQELLEEGEAR